MPIFEFLCASCGNVSEKLVLGSEENVVCAKCGGSEVKKLLSTTSTASGAKQGERLPMPGTGGGACCGSAPAARQCVPGSCCGKAGM